jgi:hypothetical protein
MRRQTIAPAVLLLLAAGCGGASFTDTTSKTLNTSLAATNAARDQFIAWDKAHQLEIVDGADTKEEAQAALAAYRAKRAPVLKAFTIAYTSIAAAAAMIPLVERGIEKDLNLIPLLVDVAHAAVAVKDAYEAIRGESP